MAAPSKAALYRLYVTQEKTLAELASFYGVAQATIRGWLAKRDIPVRVSMTQSMGGLGRDLEPFMRKVVGNFQVPVDRDIAGKIIYRQMDSLECGHSKATDLNRKAVPYNEGGQYGYASRDKRVCYRCQREAETNG